jgi:hypothetical protein
MFQVKFAWGDYFTATPVTTFGPGLYDSRQTPSASNVHVLDCLFNTINSGSEGGAIYCTSNYLLIESSSFFTCKSSSGYGGAIRFLNTNNGECVLHGVCGNNCNSGSGTDGQFACVYVRDTASSKNFVNYSSISRCVNEMSGTYKILRHDYGKIYYQSTNISMNKCYYRSAIFGYPYTDSSSVTCSLLYSTFADNHAIGYNCIRFNNNGAKYEIRCCNIIRNTQGSLGSDGTIYLRGNLIAFEGSCILENTANYIFYSTSSSYTYTLSNCTVDKTTSNQNLKIQNTVTKSFILALHHMSTRNCHSEYDSAGTLTAIPHVSHTTKKMFCYTCEKYHHQARISDFFSLSWVLMIAFIHPNPSIYHL